MLKQVAWKIGGQQGEGIDSTGDIMATVCNRLGYFIYAHKLFSSRIKGGQTTMTVRIATSQVTAPARNTHVLVALDQATIDQGIAQMVEGGYVLADASFNPSVPAGTNVVLIPIPFINIAREVGSPLMKNMVALGASACLLGLPLQAFFEYAATKFAAKGEDMVKGNITALERGYAEVAEYLKAHNDGIDLTMEPGDGKVRLLMTGNEAVALGALAAGCRFMAAYPITPATEVMENLMRLLPELGGVVVQCEDEIASIAMCVGAGFAGVRALTATSGPGFSLKQEVLGLAVMTEVPLVIVDTQRAGPSTGMPTKHEQSDVLALLYGTHGDAAKVVLSPATIKEVFADTVKAFNLADRLQTPVILATDLALAMWLQTVEEDDLSLSGVTIDRGRIADPQELLKLGRDVFKRYDLSGGPISPRSLPGQKHGQYLATGVEHSEFGKVYEDPGNRVMQMNKRMKKIEQANIAELHYEGAADPEIVLAAFGSTTGAAREAVTALQEMGIAAGLAQIRTLAPFPTAQLAQAAGAAKAVLMVESNAGAQVARVMRAEGLERLLAARGDCQLRSLLKYDGQQFTTDEVVDGALATLANLQVPPGVLPQPLVVGGDLAGPTPAGQIMSGATTAAD